MTETEFDTLIHHHEYQANLCVRDSPAWKDHTKWARDLRALKEAISQLTSKAGEHVS